MDDNICQLSNLPRISVQNSYRNEKPKQLPENPQATLAKEAGKITKFFLSPSIPPEPILQPHPQTYSRTPAAASSTPEPNSSESHRSSPPNFLSPTLCFNCHHQSAVFIQKPTGHSDQGGKEINHNLLPFLQIQLLSLISRSVAELLPWIILTF